MIAKKSDWKTKPLPRHRETFQLGLHFSSGEMERIRQGFVPRVMEDKWFLYFSEDVLHVHRSWTGYCIYRAHFRPERVGFTLTHAEVNRNPEQYTETDITEDSGHLWNVIKNFLLLRIRSFRSSAHIQNAPPDCVRFIPAQHFLGLPAPAHRPYAFYAEANVLQGQTVADCYRLVTGRTPKPLAESWPGHVVSPFVSYHSDGSWDAPLVRPVNNSGGVRFKPFSDVELDNEEFVVIKVPSNTIGWELDVFPATWSALAYILTDEQRMNARQQPSWAIEPNAYASARLHALFRDILASSDADRVALTKFREELGLCDFERVRTSDDEGKYYAYISQDSGFTNQIVDLFGISSRCWHGCGYIGWPEDPACRLFFLRNVMLEGMKVAVMRGSDILT